METGILVLITMFVTLGVYEGMKWLYRQYIYRRNRIVALEVQGKFNANHFSQIRRDIDVIMNKIRELDKLEYRLGKVEGVADNFDRDMQEYHKNINKDMRDMINKALEEYERLHDGEDIEMKSNIIKRGANYHTAEPTLAKAVEAVEYWVMPRFEYMDIIQAKYLKEIYDASIEMGNIPEREDMADFADRLLRLWRWGKSLENQSYECISFIIDEIGQKNDV